MGGCFPARAHFEHLAAGDPLCQNQRGPEPPTATEEGPVMPEPKEQFSIDKVASSGNDEFYTPRYAITPLLEFLEPDSYILCPFDTPDSLFVEVLTNAGHAVAFSHIGAGQDFFDLAPEDVAKYDYIVSNPPYSRKGDVLQHLFDLGRPFAMLVAIVGLFESQKRFEMFRDNGFEVLYFNRRVAYFKDYDDEKPSLNPPFSSAYVCSGVLPSRIEFREIDRKRA